MSRHTVAGAIVVFLTLFFLPGCLGRMVISSNVQEFNMNVVENKWGREIIFVGFYIIPVYPTCAFVDLFIVNALEFWQGENPLSGESALAEE